MKRPAVIGLRTRIARGVIALGLFMLLTQGLAVMFISESQEEGFIDQILLDEAERLTQAKAGEGPGGLLRYTVRSPADLSGLPEDLRTLAPGLHEIYRGDREMHVAVQPTADATYYLLYDATRHEERVQEFRLWLLLGLLASIALLAWAGFWLSGRLVAQVTDLAGRVEEADPNSSQSLAAGSYRDAEVQTLARALQGYMQRVQEFVRREKEFTADVSHELRTPLTAIATSCELLLADSRLEDKARTRVMQASTGAHRMAEVIDGLLLLAREAPLDDEAVSLGEAVEEALSPLLPLMEKKQLALRLDIAADARLRVNRMAFIMLLGNLLKNAVAYTETGEIRVAFEKGLLTVADTGRGIDAADLPHLFRRGYRGGNADSEGSGLGLAIVKRLCERFGWRIGVASRSGEGSSFTVDFSAVAPV